MPSSIARSRRSRSIARPLPACTCRESVSPALDVAALGRGRRRVGESRAAPPRASRSIDLLRRGLVRRPGRDHSQCAVCSSGASSRLQRAGRPALGTGVQSASDGRTRRSDVLSRGRLRPRALPRSFVRRAARTGRRRTRPRASTRPAFTARATRRQGLAGPRRRQRRRRSRRPTCSTRCSSRGSVCVLKMNPVNEWVGPFLERALRAAHLARASSRIVYGGGEVGAYLCQHAGIEDIHITGSDHTHDRIVWGPPGPEQDRRKRANDPLLKKTITSELGNVSPVAIVPGKYTDDELWFQARNVATMVVNNASFNCNAAKMLITRARLAAACSVSRAGREGARPGRRRARPTTRARTSATTSSSVVGRASASSGTAGPTSSRGRSSPASMQPSSDPLFRIEPFCGVLSQTDLDESRSGRVSRRRDALLQRATVGHAQRDAHHRSAHRGRSRRSRRRSTARSSIFATARWPINHWPAVVFGAMSPPWGGHPSATLADVQSGIGWVHNTFMLERHRKNDLPRAFTMSPKPAWFYDNKMMNVLGEKLVAFEAKQSALQIPGLAIAALKG